MEKLVKDISKLKSADYRIGEVGEKVIWMNDIKQLINPPAPIINPLKRWRPSDEAEATSIINQTLK